MSNAKQSKSKSSKSGSSTAKPGQGVKYEQGRVLLTNVRTDSAGVWSAGVVLRTTTMFGPLQSLVEQYNTVDFRGGYYKVEFVPRVGLNTPGMITMALTSDPTDSFTATFEELSVLQQSRTGHVHKKMSAPLPTAALVGPRGGKYTVSPSSPYSGVGWAGAYVESEPDTLVGSLFAIYRFRLGERVPPPPRELHAKTGSLQHHNFSGVASNADDNIPRDTFRKQAYNVYANIARGMYLAYGIPMSTYGFSEADLIAPWDDDVCIKVAKMILPQVKSDLDGHIDFASGGFGEPVLPLVVAPEAEIEHLEVGMYSRSLGFTNGYAGNLFQASNVLYEQVDGSLAPVTAPSVVEGHYQTNITNDANGHYDIVKIHGDEFNRNSFTDTRHPGSNLREHDVINVRIGNGAVNVDPDAADSVSPLLLRIGGKVREYAGAFAQTIEVIAASGALLQAGLALL